MSSTTASQSSNPNTPPTCLTCKKASSNLKVCTKCKVVRFCDKECQKKVWKSHKILCPLLAQVAGTGGSTQGAFTNNASSSRSQRSDPLKNLETQVDDPFSKLSDKTWLHNRSEKDTFQLLVDSFLLRQDDEYEYHGRIDEDSLYGGQKDSRSGFKKYLRLAEKRSGLLPPWWDQSKQDECIRFGLRLAWSPLEFAVEKSDIIEHYGSSVMPMQMRMFSDTVYGVSINGPIDGGSAQGMQSMQRILEIMKRGETSNGDYQTSVINLDIRQLPFL